MSLFRKPKKIQRRVFCADDDEDGDPEPPPPPIISQNRKENKPIKSIQLLSFADEEEDGEVFKVKKSSQSKKLAKRREKEKRRIPENDCNSIDNKEYEDIPAEEKVTEKPKKKVTLEGLILSGREALAADGTGDVSSGSENEDSRGFHQYRAESVRAALAVAPGHIPDAALIHAARKTRQQALAADGTGDVSSGSENEDSRGFHQYRAESVRAALAVAPGHIPDAALIHAARKTRQQARELGDYVPIKTENAPGSRLARDDDMEDDDDDEEDGRIEVRGLELPSDKPKRTTTATASDEEINSEAEEWEEQQMQKAVPAMADITAVLDNGEVNPFSVAPPPPRPDDAPQMRALIAPGKAPPATAQELVDALRERLSELEAMRVAAVERRERCRERLLAAARVRESRAARARPLDAAYRRAQAVRGYLTDLVECLDEKMPQLEALEARALALHRRRCEFLIERRRADVRDQAQDVLALAARSGAARPVESEEKSRRTAEREGRRRARRLRREAAGTALAHRDGDSSDDEPPPAIAHAHRAAAEEIRREASALFADALPAWRSVRGVCARLARWRRRAPALYADAYIAQCLPQLLAPYVRHQLILWNPLADEDNEDYEKMDWYKCLMMYGVRPEKVSSDSEQSSEEEEPVIISESSVRTDLDLMLVPTIIDKVVLPKVTELVEQAWDPMSVRACVRLRQLVVRAAELPRAPGLPRLAAAAHARLTHALNADVFLPALPPHVVEGGGGLFWRRCLGGGVRLLRATLALCAPPAALRADPLALKLIETLCCAAGAAPGPQMAAAAAALTDTLPRVGGLRRRALRRLAALAQLATSRLHSDNPLHLKALEQTRAILAEAKSET